MSDVTNPLKTIRTNKRTKEKLTHKNQKAFKQTETNKQTINPPDSHKCICLDLSMCLKYQIKATTSKTKQKKLLQQQNNSTRGEACCILNSDCIRMSQRQSQQHRSIVIVTVITLAFRGKEL